MARDESGASSRQSADTLTIRDAQLALWTLYELSDRGFQDVCADAPRRTPALDGAAGRAGDRAPCRAYGSTDDGDHETW